MSIKRIVKTQRFISLAKGKKQKECASDLSDPGHQGEIYRMAGQMVRERWDVAESGCLGGVLGRVVMDERGIGIHGESAWEELMGGELSLIHISEPTRPY